MSTTRLIFQPMIGLWSRDKMVHHVKIAPAQMEAYVYPEKAWGLIHHLEQ